METFVVAKTDYSKSKIPDKVHILMVCETFTKAFSFARALNKEEDTHEVFRKNDDGLFCPFTNAKIEPKTLIP